MRARRRHFLLTLVAAVTVSLFGPSAPAPGSAAAWSCPASTSWDNVLHRCV